MVSELVHIFSGKNYSHDIIVYLYLIDFKGMSIGSLMIWWHMHSRAMEVMYGHAKTMMEMSRAIS